MRLRCVLLLCLILPLASRAEPACFTPAQLRQDVAAIRAHLATVHPDPGYAGQASDIRLALARVERQLDRCMTQDEAWRVMATLNPAFADAHMQVLIPDWRGQTRAHLGAGGKLFPFEVQADSHGALRIRSALGGQPTPYAGMRITRINGMPARDVARRLLARAAGDSADFRASHLSWRMWLPYWKVFGAPAFFDLVIEGKGALRVPASGALPEILDDSPERLFRFDMLPDNAGLLTINSFMLEDGQRFRAFTRSVFTQLRASKSRVLIIDIRHNGGGDDGHWKEGLLPYLATRPYRHTSTYIKKVIAGRESAAEPLGSIIGAEYTRWDQPDLANPLRFEGEVYVLVGRMTYSSAIVFANVMQDFGFGKLVGERGHARTRQSGGTQERTLPHTGLGLVLPRMVLERPAGPRAQPFIEPDIVLTDDAFQPRALVDALLAWRGAYGATMAAAAPGSTAPATVSAVSLPAAPPP